MERNSECWYVSTCDDDCQGCLVYKQMKWQFDNSGLPKAKYNPIELIATSDTINSFRRLADIRKSIEQFVSEGNNLYICGANPGTGKTSWAIKILQTYFHHVAVGNYGTVKGMFVQTTGLLLQLKDFNNPISQEYKDNLFNADLIVWDDIAVAGMSAYDYNQLFTIIDRRVLEGKSNIFTSNCSDLQTLSKSLGERLASRVWSTSERIEIRGGDWRGRTTSDFKNDTNR